jgi:hypothetical protein
VVSKHDRACQEERIRTTYKVCSHLDAAVVGYKEKGGEVVITLLLEKGADVESEDNHGWTPLSLAAENGHEAVIKPLLEKGANVKSKDKDGLTPLLRTVEMGHEAIAKLLLKKSNEKPLDQKGLRRHCQSSHTPPGRLYVHSTYLLPEVVSLLKAALPPLGLARLNSLTSV